MTNEQKANELATTVGSTSQYIYSLCLQMAEWKDEQFVKEKQQLIEKVCEWLDKNIPLYEDLNEKECGDMSREYLLKDLKNEMKNL